MKNQLFLLFAFLLLQQNAQCQEADSIVLSNAVLYYYTYGNGGQPLVLLSGGPGGNGHHMDHMIGELDKNYKLILFDQRGTGRSWTEPFDTTTINIDQAIEDIEALRKNLGVSQLNLLGRSWGSMLAAGYISKYPKRVNLFISVCGGGLDSSLQSTIYSNIKALYHDRDSIKYRYWRDPEIIKLDSAKAAYERAKLYLATRVFDSTKIEAQ